MNCPFCGATSTKVIDSRLASDGDQIRRRRKCDSCEARFTTYENALLSMPQVIKSDKKTVPFDEQKLRAGMMRALENRPVKPALIEAAIRQVMRSLALKTAIKSQDIGTLIMEKLLPLDQIAYIRFASVYRDFKNLAEFKNEIERLLNKPK